MKKISSSVAEKTLFPEGDWVVLRLYGPVNHIGQCQARPVYLTTLLLGRLSPLSG